MLYRRILDRDSLICRENCGGGLGAVKKYNHYVDRLMETMPKVQY